MDWWKWLLLTLGMVSVSVLDDTLIVAWALRRLVANAEREHIAHHWRGDQDTLDRVLRLARVP